MPVVVHDDKAARSVARFADWDRHPECIHIALVNNMPDLALEDTELQFIELLDAASDNVGVHVQFFSLPGISRSARSQQRLDNFYFDISDLGHRRFDAVIVTGTEPHQFDLRKEPYWCCLADLLDWAEENTLSTILSCLAAHAGVLYSDGISRRHLGNKQFGVFAFNATRDHPLTGRSSGLLQFPHSRWNEVRSDALRSCGYQVVSESPSAGVDLFVKKKRKSLFVHFQGHPEYGKVTLFKEYRRDVKRFLKGERHDYPGLPYGYFDSAAIELLSAFRQQALDNRSEELMSFFPETPIAGTLEHTWRASATGVYRQWLQYVMSRKTESLTFAAMPRIGRARSAAG
jgi:homoserine O-succinyltransferase/O-acetyltransferase